MQTTKIIDFLSLSEFKKLLKNKPVTLSKHASHHISSHQREIYTEEHLRQIATGNPQEIGVQRNGCLRVTYRRKEGLFILVFSEKHDRLEIITFIKPKTLRRIEHVEKTEMDRKAS